MAGPHYHGCRSAFWNFAEVAGTFGHFVEHAADLLPGDIDLCDLRGRDVVGIPRVI